LTVKIRMVDLAYFIAQIKCYPCAREIILDILREGEPWSCSERAKKAKLTRSQVGNSLMLVRLGGHVLRTAESIFEVDRLNKGRGVRAKKKP